MVRLQRAFNFALVASIVFTGVILSVDARSAEFCINDAAGLSGAIAAAEANGEDDTIQVVQGNYNGRLNYSSDQGNSIAVLGGYTPACTARVIAAENTILDGGGSGPVISFYLENGGNILLEGVTVRNGSLEYEGGGVYARSFSDSSPAGDITIRSNHIADNHSGTKGGGVFAYSYSSSSSAGNVTLRDNTITGNSADESGGGASAISQSTPGTGGNVVVANNTFRNNTSGWGGSGVRAMAHSNTGTAGTVELTGNIITANSATNASSRGGGGQVSSYSVTGSASAVTICGNTVAENTCNQDGGGIFAESTGPVQSGPVVLSDNRIMGNRASRWYGGLFVQSGTSLGTSGDVVLVNNVIAQNSAGEHHGGAYVTSSSSSGTAGVVTLTNNTIAGNSAGFVDGGLSLHLDDNTIELFNNIVYGNTAASGVDIYLSGTGSANAYNNNYATLSGSWSNQAENIDLEPGFVNAPAGDYHLKPSSPCIDRGNNNTGQLPAYDHDGDARRIDGDHDGTATVDIGADEYVWKAGGLPWMPLLLIGD